MKAPVIVAGGLDPSGGAGLSSDIRVCAFFNVYPLPVITAITYQNEKEFYGFETVKAEQIEKQLASILNFYPIRFAKIGLVASHTNLELLLHTLDKHGIKIIFDPVLTTTTNGKVYSEAFIESIKNNSKKIYLVTPNIEEAKKITGENTNNQNKLGELMLNMGFKNVLIKGGHLEKPDDLFINETESELFSGERIETDNTRGTGCALSSAITSSLALGKGLKESISIAKNYLQKTMKHNYRISYPNPLNLNLK